jgi:hypothetical protein
MREIELLPHINLYCSIYLLVLGLFNNSLYCLDYSIVLNDGMISD